MSFQSSARSLRSRLHLHRYKTSTIAAILVFSLIAGLAVVIGVVLLVREHAAAVVRIDEAQTLSLEDMSFSDVDEESAPIAELESTPVNIVVYVSGAVVSPGLYELEEGSRVGEAIELAGGSLGSASLESVNLARIIHDGDQIHVPSQEDIESGWVVAGSYDGLGGGQSQSSVVNINTAGLEQLTTLDGVGEATANRIIADREANGPFAAIEDIMRVSGIGQKKFDAIKDRICV